MKHKKFVLGGFCPGGFVLGVLSGGFLSWGGFVLGIFIGMFMSGGVLSGGFLS